MDMQTILMILGGSAAAFFGAQAIGKVDNRVEDHKRNAVNLAAWAKANGLGLVGQLLTNFAINDISGMIGNFRQIADTVADPSESQAMVQRFLEVQLSKQLETEAGQEALITFIEQKLRVTIDRESIKAKPVTLTEFVSPVTKV